MEIIQSTPKTQSTSSKYAYEDFMVFVDRAEEGGIEQKFQFIDGEIIPTHSATPLSHWFIDYVLSKDFGTQPITLQFDMATYHHDTIIYNINKMLMLVADDKDLKVYVQGTHIHLEISSKTLVPDISVASKQDEKRNRFHQLLNPRLIFEVLSKSTKSIDQGEKVELYQSISSVVEYVIIDQYKPQVTVHKRISESKWEKEFFSSLTNSIYLESIKHSLSLASIYEGVSFEE